MHSTFPSGPIFWSQPNENFTPIKRIKIEILYFIILKILSKFEILQNDQKNLF